MYTARDYGAMVADSVRMGAYRQAIEQSVRGGDVVCDLGAGTGVLSLLACQAGASHVYAVDTNPNVERGHALARANGFADCITYVQEDAFNFTPDRQVNVLIGDIRGSLPTVAGLDLFRDAAHRYLADSGQIVPQLDRAFIAPLGRAHLYRTQVEEPWIRNELGLDLSAELPRVLATPIRARVGSDEGMLEPQAWADFDYRAGSVEIASRTFEWTVGAASTLHFLALWFNATLAHGIGFSNAPGAGGPKVYGQTLLPLARPLRVQSGDFVKVRFRTNDDYSVWSWNTEVVRHGECIELLEQSNLGALDLDAIRKHRDGVPA